MPGRGGAARRGPAGERSARRRGGGRRPARRALSDDAADAPRVRLFLALDPTDAGRRTLVRWRERATAGRDDLRPVPDEALHLTLVFIGYRGEDEIPAIARTALAAVDELPAGRLLPLRVTGVPPRRPRLFALDLEDEGGRAAAIQAAASDALAGAAMYVPERRPFWPHLTFARVRRGRRAEEPAVAAPEAAIAAARVTLYRSHLSPHGARYEALAAADLPPASDADDVRPDL